LLRFLFGGLATVAGLVLLFVASFGDPAAVLDRLHEAFPVLASDHAPIVTADNAGAGRAADHVVPVVPANQPRPASLAKPDNQPSLASPPVMPPASAPVPANQPQPLPEPPSPKNASRRPQQSSPPSDLTAALQQRREALEQQLQRLQNEMAQASQNVSSLHSRADQAQRDLDNLQQQRATEEAALRQAAAHERDAAKPSAPEANPAPAMPEPQQPGSGATIASPPQTTPTTQPSPAPAQVAQTTELPEPLPLPPPLPENPPRESQPAEAHPVVAAAAPAPPQFDSRTDVANVPSRQLPRRTVQNDFGAMQAALDRLRHEASGPNPQPPPSATDNSVRHENASGADLAQNEPRQIAPHSRLAMARAALQTGRVDEARQYLEKAQLQLVFRPVTPTDGGSVGTSRLASDVASALSMLGAGNTSAALQYLDRAMSPDVPRGYATQQSYVFRGPYGGAPLADADR
jgi:hypothetical protein